jgi:hypothetical protein
MAKADKFDELLNAKATVQGSDRTPRLPDVEGSFDVEVLTFKSPESDTKMYISEFVVEKSTHPLVLAGSRYCRMWFLEGHKGAAEMAAKRMRPYLAACVGANTGDDDFDAIAVKTDLMNLSEAGTPIGAKIRITTRLGAPSKTKFDENGKGKRYIEDTYDSLGE